MLRWTQVPSSAEPKYLALFEDDLKCACAGDEKMPLFDPERWWLSVWSFIWSPSVCQGCLWVLQVSSELLKT